MTLQLGWYSTGRGEGSRGLLAHALQAIERGELDARIQFIFSNREPGESEGSDRYFQMIRENGIPLVCYSSRKFRQRMGPVAQNRAAYDEEVLKRLEPFSPDVVVLAGYMLIVSEAMCRRYVILNLHPALPSGPKGTWQEVICQLIAQCASETGAMVHLATTDVDEGPPISYFSIPIQGDLFNTLWQTLQKDPRPLDKVLHSEGTEYPLFKAIREEERRREPYLLVKTLEALAAGRIRIVDHCVVDAHGQPVAPRCLNTEIEAALQAKR